MISLISSMTALALFYAVSVFADSPAGLPSIPAFAKSDRVLILAPHPDDETICTAGVIQNALSAGADVYVACYTNGDANQLAFIMYEKRLTFLKGEFIHMGEVRKKETLSALDFLGVKREKIFFLGYPDIGTMQILLKYWGTNKSYRSVFTRSRNVPHDENLSPNAPYTGESILKDIKTVLLKTRPTKIFVSHPADTNGDHQSLYLFLQVALWDLSGRIKRPAVYPFLVHCKGWPSPRRRRTDLSLGVPKGLETAPILWQRLELTEDQVHKKDKATGFYRSQMPYNARFLRAFSRKNELFGDYPFVVLREQKSVGIKWQNVDAAGGDGFLYYAKKAGKLYIKFSVGRQITKGVTSFVYLLGYSKKTKFADMPKIRLALTRNKLVIFNKRSRVFVNDAKMSVADDSIIVDFPLAGLNFPDFILCRVNVHTSSVPPDVSSWRVLKIE